MHCFNAWTSGDGSQIIPDDLNRLLAACKRLPCAPIAPDIAELNAAAKGMSPSNLYVSQTLRTVRPGR